MQADNDDNGLNAIIIDEVVETAPIDKDGNFMLVVRSEQTILGLIFNAELAEDAAQMLIEAAER